jgi:transcriptional regulator with XRE-family HTH domain
MKRDYSQHIKKLRAARKLTQHDLAELLRVRPQVVASWEQGRKQPSARNYQQLAKLSPPAEAWFFLGKIGITRQFVRSKWRGLGARTRKKQPLLRPPEIRLYTTEQWKQTAPDQSHFQVQIPVLRDESAASPPRELRERDIRGFIAAPASSVPKGPGAYTAFYLRDDSMRSTMRDGFLVVVDHTERDPMLLRGRLVAARVHGAAVVRQLAPESRPDRVILRPESPGYEEIILESLEENPIVGDVVFWWGTQ